MIYEIISASKEHSEADIRAGISAKYPGFKIEALDGSGDEWQIRLVADGNPFADKKKDDSSSDSSDDSSDEKADEKEDAEDGGSDEESENEGDEKGDKKGDPVKEVQQVIDSLQQLLTDLGGKTQDLQDAHEDKAQKLKDIGDTVGDEHGPGGGEPGLDGPVPGDLAGLDDVGPGEPPVGAGGPVPPGGPRRPGVPTGRGKPKGPIRPPSGIPTFTNVEVVTHPGVDEDGNKLGITAVAAALEADNDWAGYEVLGMVANRDGSYSAKLKKAE